MPDSTGLMKWRFWIAFLLLFTGIFLPLRIAFIDDAPLSMIIWETIVDACFLIDIVLTFFSAVDTKGHIEVRHSILAANYLKGWFLIDLIAVFPSQIFEAYFHADEDSRDFELSKLARLPRIYRIVKIFRLIKLFRTVKNTGSVTRLFD